MPLPPLITANAPGLDPQAPLLRAIRSRDPDAAALFDLPEGARGAEGQGTPWLAGLLARAAQVQRRELPRQELAALLEGQAVARGAGRESLVAARRVADPEVVAVLTGQQVGLFGGPALTLYKALGAVATARALGRAGVPAVPIFWMATFDHDLDEVARVEVVAGEHDRRRLRLGGCRRGPGVGEIPLGSGIDRLRSAFVDGLRGVAALEAGLGRVEELLAELYTARETFGGAFARLLGGLTDRLGLVLLDPSDPRFAGLEPARALVTREIEGRGAWSARALAMTGAELSRRGFDPQVPERRGGRLGVFFSDDEGRRVALLGDPTGVRPPDGSWRRTWDEIRALAAHSPDRFTPDVLLRPLLQDACLPTVAYIGGPSELQYHAQLGALYTDLGIPRPLPLCRPSLTLVDVADAEIVGGEALGERLRGQGRGIAGVARPGEAEDGLKGEGSRGASAELARFVGLLGAPWHGARRELVHGAMSEAECALIETLGELQDHTCAALAADLRKGARECRGPGVLLDQLGQLRADVAGLVGGLGGPTEPRVSTGVVADGSGTSTSRSGLRSLVEGAVAEVLAQLDQQGRALRDAEAGEVPSGRALARARRRLRWLRTQLRKRARRRATAALSALSRLRPQGRPQERSLSLAQLVAWLGGRAADRLLPVSLPATPHALVAIPRNTPPIRSVGEPAVLMRSRTAEGDDASGTQAQPQAETQAGSPLRIGIVCLGGLGGSTKVAVEVAVGLAEAGHTLHLLHGAEPEALAAWLPASHPSITLHSLPLRSTPGPTRTSELDRASARLREICAEQRLDCVHVHYAADLLGCSLRAVQGLDIPVIATLHGTDVTPWRRGAGHRGVLSADLRRCAEVTAVSTWLSEQALEILDLEAAPRVISNSVDPAVFRPRPDLRLRERLGGGDELLLIHVSNLRPVKRPGDAVRILARLRQQGLAARLLIVGVGPELDALRREASELGVRDALSCVGRLAPEELARYLSVADVALLPSESESFGLAALEAMACGTPVVGTRCGGLEEVVAAVDGERGELRELLCEVGDVAAMVAAIRGLLKGAYASPDERRALELRLVHGAGTTFPLGRQLAAYAALIAGAVTRRADDDRVRAAG